MDHGTPMAEVLGMQTRSIAILTLPSVFADHAKRPSAGSRAHAPRTRRFRTWAWITLHIDVSKVFQKTTGFKVVPAASKQRRGDVQSGATFRRNVRGNVILLPLSLPGLAVHAAFSSRSARGDRHRRCSYDRKNASAWSPASVEEMWCLRGRESECSRWQIREWRLLQSRHCRRVELTGIHGECDAGTNGENLPTI